MQIALSRQEILTLPLTRSRKVSIDTSISEPEPELVTPEPAPPPPDLDLNGLYRAGVVARSEGNLERIAIFWQQVLDRDPNFGNGTVKPQMERLLPESRPIRVKRLREQAEEAHQAGEWGREIGAWQALLGLEPNDEQASVETDVRKCGH